jgi:hypothetical protein
MLTGTNGLGRVRWTRRRQRECADLLLSACAARKAAEQAFGRGDPDAGQRHGATYHALAELLADLVAEITQPPARRRRG